MRVLMAAGFYSLGGFSTVIENLADQLGKMGIDVTIGALNFKRIPPKGAYRISALPVHNASKLRKFLGDFDIVHNHHPITNYLALLSKSPFVYHYHGAPDIGRGYLFRSNMLLSIKLTNHAFDVVIAVSESGAMELKQCFSLDNVHVVYNGVNTHRFKQCLDDRFRTGTPQFLFVGNLYEHKSVEELIIALKELIKNYPKAQLQIVGSGSSFSRLQNLAAKLDIQDHVTLLGNVPDHELPYFYGSCDVYVTASRYEACPVPLLEAMACGKPIVASSIRSHEELLSASKAGKIYELGDVLDLCTTVTAVYEHKDEFKYNALQFATDHDWSVVADRVAKIYTEILSD